MPNAMNSARDKMPAKVGKEKGVVGKYGSIDGYEKYPQSPSSGIMDKKMEGNVGGNVITNMNTARTANNKQTDEVNRGNPNSSKNNMSGARK